MQYSQSDLSSFGLCPLCQSCMMAEPNFTHILDCNNCDITLYFSQEGYLEIINRRVSIDETKYFLQKDIINDTIYISYFRIDGAGPYKDLKTFSANLDILDFKIADKIKVVLVFQ